MKYFGYFYTAAGSVIAMDCGQLNTGRSCNPGLVTPVCDTGTICFQNADDNCIYSCQPEEHCQGTKNIWSYSPEKENKISYCAETPHLPSYSCAYNNGSPAITASFGSIKTAYPSLDKRQYEFYPKTFEKTEYKYGMFDIVTDDCKTLLNKTIDTNGVTTFNFPLNDDVITKCGINGIDYYTNVEYGENVLHQKFEFAIGYDDLMRRLPFGLMGLLQPGKHFNIECDVTLSGTTAVSMVNDPTHSSDLPVVAEPTIDIANKGPIIAGTQLQATLDSLEVDLKSTNQNIEHSETNEGSGLNEGSGSLPLEAKVNAIFDRLAWLDEIRLGISELAAVRLDVEGSNPRKAEFFDQYLRKSSTKIRDRLCNLSSKTPEFFDAVDLDQYFDAETESFNRGDICDLVDRLKNAYVSLANRLSLNQNPPKAFTNNQKKVEKLSEELKEEMNC